MKRGPVLSSHQPTGSRDVLVVSETPSQACRRQWTKDEELGGKNASWWPSGVTEEQEGALGARPLPNSRKHRQNCCCLPGEFSWDYSLRLGQLMDVQQVLNSDLVRASSPSCSSTWRITKQWLDVHHQTLQDCKARWYLCPLQQSKDYF